MIHKNKNLMQNKAKQNKEYESKAKNKQNKKIMIQKKKMNHHSPWLKYISIYNERKKKKLASSAMFEVHIHIQQEKKKHHNYTLHYIS